MATEQSQESSFHVFFLIRCNQTLSISKILSSQFTLCFNQTFYQRTEHFEQLFVTFRNRTRNNQRCTCIINQYRVHLIDDGIIMFTLYQVFRADSHIITQVVETKFIVGTECNICHVSTTASFRVRLMLIDAVYTQAMEHIERSHPFRVTLSQVIVHGNHMYTITRQGIQEYRQCSNQGFTFTGCHFSNLTLMQYNTTK